MTTDPKGVVKTFFLDWGLSLAAGLMFGFAGRHEIAVADSPFSTRAFRLGFAYQNAGVLGIAVALYLIQPDWMWMYWVPSARLPIAVVVLSFFMYELAFFAGFSVAPALARRRVIMPAFVLVGAALTAGEIAARDRLGRFGTIDEYIAGTARHGLTLSPFHAEPVLTFFAIAGTASILGLVLLLRSAAHRPS